MSPLQLIFSVMCCSQLVVPIASLASITSKSDWIADDEKRLVNFLFKNYSKIVRPVIKKSAAVPMEMQIALTQLIDLNEKEQILVTSVWLRLRWVNGFMKWNSSDFGDIKSINVDPKMVWLPDIELYNSADGHLSQSFTKKVIIHENGQNVWYIPVILRSFCQIDIEYFPFDEQICALRFGSWTYHGFQLDLTLTKKPTDLNPYKSSGEFGLVSFTADREILRYSCCKEPYINLVFTIHFRRKMLFYLNNLIVPCILITVASLFTFILPPNTGERVTLVITTLLSLTVFMLMIAENTPTNSDVTPMIAKFFMASMIEIGLALVITCLILNVYHSTRHSLALPHFIRVLAVDVLAPLLFVATPRKKKPSKLSASRSNASRDTKHEGFVLAQTLPQANRRNHTARNGHARRDVMDSPDEVMYRQRSPDEDDDEGDSESENEYQTNRQACRTRLVQERLLSNMRYLAQREREREKQELVLDEWEIVAKVADRTFLVLFIITLTCTSFVIFTNVPKQPEIQGS